jgi:hypothetical protein
MRRRYIDSALQTKSMINDAHRTNMIKISQDDEWKKKSSHEKKNSSFVKFSNFLSIRRRSFNL